MSEDDVAEKLAVHEAICAERWKQTDVRLNRMELVLVAIVLLLLFGEGMFGTGGSFSMGSLGSTLGGIGVGFGIGSALGGLIANSPAQRQNSHIGAVLESIAGAIGAPWVRSSEARRAAASAECSNRASPCADGDRGCSKPGGGLMRRRAMPWRTACCQSPARPTTRAATINSSKPTRWLPPSMPISRSAGPRSAVPAPSAATRMALITLGKMRVACRRGSPGCASPPRTKPACSARLAERCSTILPS